MIAVYPAILASLESQATVDSQEFLVTAASQERADIAASRAFQAIQVSQGTLDSQVFRATQVILA